MRTSFHSRAVLALLIAPFLLGGCESTPRSEVPPGLAYAFAGGDFVSDLALDPLQILDAAAASLRAKGLTNVQVRRDKARGSVRCLSEKRESITLRIRPMAGSITRVSVRYGTFGDEVASAALVATIIERIKTAEQQAPAVSK